MLWSRSNTQLSCSLAVLSSTFFSDSACNNAVLQPRGCRNTRGLGFSPFARHYWGNHSYFLFLQVLRCFSSLRWPPPSGGCCRFAATGCPIRRSAGQGSFAPNRGFSQLITSFIASKSLGIHHVPFSTCSRAGLTGTVRSLEILNLLLLLVQHVKDLLSIDDGQPITDYYLFPYVNRCLWRITDSNR